MIYFRNQNSLQYHHDLLPYWTLHYLRPWKKLHGIHHPRIHALCLFHWIKEIKIAISQPTHFSKIKTLILLNFYLFGQLKFKIYSLIPFFIVVGQASNLKRIRGGCEMLGLSKHMICKDENWPHEIYALKSLNIKLKYA